MAFVAGLNNAAITRLKHTRAEIPSKLTKVRQRDGSNGMGDTFAVTAPDGPSPTTPPDDPARRRLSPMTVHASDDRTR